MVEWIFICFLIVVCAVLSGFQYHWTNEVSRATTERLRSGFDGQVQLLGRAFDAGLLEAINQLLPGDEPLTANSRATVHESRLKHWLAGKPRPFFRSVAVAVPENSGLQFYLLDQKTGRFTRAVWPVEWNALRDNLARKSAAGSGPPFQDPTGTVSEYPVFRNHLENEWVIFELDCEYVGKVWLPALIQQFLNQDGQLLSDVTVHPFLRPDDIIYATGASAIDTAPRSASVRFNDQGWGTTIPNRKGENDFWVLTASQKPGALEKIVAVARWRNFVLACLLNLLTLAAGFALLRYARRARQVSSMHMRFVANASHELRTPLTVIRAAGENLILGVTSDMERIAQYGRFIVQHAEQLQHLIEGMLELADVRRLAAAPKLEVIRLQDVLESAVAATLADTRAAGCKVETQIFSRLPPVRGDAAALRRVFQNLIVNAAKYAASGGWIGIKTDQIKTTATSMIEVRVEDHGPGIPEQEQANIFEPFARGAANGERQIKGSGLGLSMVQEIVQSHGGTISLRSVPGKGTTFIVCLPELLERAT